VVADDQECWLPKSLIEVDKLGDDTARIVLPEWLAPKRVADLSLEGVTGEARLGLKGDTDRSRFA